MARAATPAGGSDSYRDVSESLAAARGAAEDERAVARDDAIRRCLPVAENLARKFAGRGEPLEDLHQVARLALVQAIDRYDPDRGELLAFVVPTILGALRRHFRDTGWSARVPRRLQELHLSVNAAITELAGELGRGPTLSEIADRLGVSTAEVSEAVVAGNSYRARSLDAQPEAGAPSLAETLGETDRGYELVEEFATLRPALERLSPREREILSMRFYQGMTQSQIASRVGVSQMQISRVLGKVLRQLRSETS